jgi:hypothetical protein
MGNRPDIPKRHAARITSAQERIHQKRLSIVYGEKNYAQSCARVAEFEADPDGFSSRYYGRYDRYSYPVQTNIANNRERNAYYERRRDERFAELAELEAQIFRIEAETLVEVTQMSLTKGRVPWPRYLPAMEQFKDELEEQIRRSDNQLRIERSADDALFYRRRRA